MVYPNKPFTAFVFKTVVDPFAGKLSYVRIFSGELKEGDKLYNMSQDKEEKMGKVLTLVRQGTDPRPGGYCRRHRRPAEIAECPDWRYLCRS